MGRAVLMLDGIGRKIGDLTQYLAQVVFAFIVAFYFKWKLTVVLIAAFPVIAASGAFMINAVTAATVSLVTVNPVDAWQ